MVNASSQIAFTRYEKNSPALVETWGGGGGGGGGGGDEG